METRPDLDAQAVEAILPHRPPARLVDRVVEGSPARLVALHRVRPDAPWLEGHFPGNPMVPGVMLIEAMAQACLVLYAYNFEVEDLFYLCRDRSTFTAPARPGDELRITALRVKFLETMGVARAEVHVGETLVASSELTFAAASDDGGR